jgi:hypothetical protein
MTIYTRFASGVFDITENELRHYSNDNLQMLLQVSEKKTAVGHALLKLDKETPSYISDDLMQKYAHPICQDLFEKAEDIEGISSLIQLIKNVNFPTGHFDHPGRIWNRLIDYRRYSRGTRNPTNATLRHRLPLEKYALKNRKFDILLFGSVRYGDANEESDINLYFIGDVSEAKKKKLTRILEIPINPGEILDQSEIFDKLGLIANNNLTTEFYQFPWQNLIEGIYLIGQNKYIDHEKTSATRRKVLETANKNPLFSHILASKLSESLGKRMTRK